MALLSRFSFRRSGVRTLAHAAGAPFASIRPQPPRTARRGRSPLLGSLLCSDKGGGCTVAATDTASLTENAMAFFDAIDTGQGWEACSAYCDPDATFEPQADALADVHTLRDYAEWMKGMLAVLPDA